MTHAKRIQTLNAAILAVRPHGFLAEDVLEPLQTLRDDLQAEHDEKHPRPRHAQDHGTTPAADRPAEKKADDGK